MFTPGVKEAVQGNSWMLFPAFLLSMGLLVALHVKRKETPINLILLAAFTVVEVLWPLAPVTIQNLQIKNPSRRTLLVFWSPSLTKPLLFRCEISFTVHISGFSSSELLGFEGRVDTMKV